MCAHTHSHNHIHALIDTYPHTRIPYIHMFTHTFSVSLCLCLSTQRRLPELCTGQHCSLVAPMTTAQPDGAWLLGANNQDRMRSSILGGSPAPRNRDSLKEGRRGVEVRVSSAVCRKQRQDMSAPESPGGGVGSRGVPTSLLGPTPNPSC